MATLPACFSKHLQMPNHLPAAMKQGQTHVGLDADESTAAERQVGREMENVWIGTSALQHMTERRNFYPFHLLRAAPPPVTQ